jgi:hypothetical protein
MSKLCNNIVKNVFRTIYMYKTYNELKLNMKHKYNSTIQLANIIYNYLYIIKITKK